jgi:hypothetical protein
VENDEEEQEDRTCGCISADWLKKIYDMLGWISLWLFLIYISSATGCGNKNIEAKLEKGLDKIAHEIHDTRK